MNPILRRFDFFLFLPMVLLLIFGLMSILSANREVFDRQILFAVSGLAFYFILTFIDYRSLRSLSLGIYLAFIGFLVLVLILGVVSRGSVRWLTISEARFQPSEFSKLALLLLLASLLESAVGFVNLKIIAKSIVVTAIPALLVFIQPDLGTTLVLLTIWLGMIFIAGLPIRYIFLMLATVILSAIPIWQLLHDYQRQRITTFLYPALDPLGRGYHVLQSIIAVGSGQFMGRGFGRGTQSHLNFLPEHYTDFIFATIAEEWGFVGALLIVILFGLLLGRVLWVAFHARDDYGVLIASGVFVYLLFQVFINIGMNIGITPVTGIPLPLISYGGSSLWVTLLALGLVQSVATHRDYV